MGKLFFKEIQNWALFFLGIRSIIDQSVYRINPDHLQSKITVDKSWKMKRGEER